MATPKTIVVLFLAGVWLTVAFSWRSEYLSEIAEPPLAAGEKIRTIDGMFFYTPDGVHAMVARYGPQGRQFYAATQVTLDVLFPIVYGLFFALALTWACSRAFTNVRVMQRLSLLLPAVAVLADYAENAGSVVLLLSYPSRVPVLAWISAVATATKWVAVVACLAVLAVAMVRWALKPPTP